MRTNTPVAAIQPLNFCRACQRDFGGIAAFDIHHVGKHAYLYSEEQPDGRRCLSQQEKARQGHASQRAGPLVTAP
jgi:hypothetical protein